MKKVILFVLAILVLFSCNNRANDSGNNNSGNNDSVDYTLAEKLTGKTFSYYNQDVEAGDEAVLFKKSIAFGSVNRDSNSIPLTITDKDGNTASSDYDIINNTIEGKELNAEKIDAVREFDKEFTLDGKRYENCDQKMKWAKLLENNTYNYYGLGNHEYLYIFSNIDSHNNKLNVSSAWYSVYAKTTLNNDIYFYDINTHQEVRKATETADPTYDNIHSITETSFKIGSNTDGNGITTFTKK